MNEANRSEKVEPESVPCLQAMSDALDKRMDDIRHTAERLELLADRLVGPGAVATEQAAPQPVAAVGVLGLLEHQIDHDMRALFGRLARVVDRIGNIA